MHIRFSAREVFSILRLFSVVFISMQLAGNALAVEPGSSASQALAHKPYGRVLSQKDTSSLPASVQTAIKRLAPRLKQARGGVCVVFEGRAGTGKTLAASLLATSLGRQAYEVDLAAVMSKYIGETEKNLNKLFATASANHWVLLFDEADALFGKRTEVKDSHDRYANMETSYLLQRLEAYQGIWILTSNARLQLDSALKKRCKHRLIIQ
jgi:SpoVK/Ycf46/Vps4 family AAA+-type ATPase